MILKDFKNIHKEKDIYVVGSGKSLDFIDKSFFENKITIGVNQVFKKFVPTYSVRKEHCLLKSILDLGLNTVHFVSKYDTGNHKSKTNYNLDGTIVFDHDHNNCKVNDNLPSGDKLIVSYSTITTGIHLAAYMGAKNIIIIGHDCGTIDGEPNFKGYHTNNTYRIAHPTGKSGYINWLKKIELDTIKLRGLLKKKYGCNVYSLNPFINFGLEGHKYKR